MADFVSLLVDMGFDPEKSKMAVEKTGNQGVEPAMEWILSHPDEPSPSAEGGGSNDNTSTTTPATDTKTEEVPKSWKCEDCGKLFASMDTVEFHAAKTNHSNFSESTEEKKPLTAEEKAEQQKKLVELMKTKRVEREAKEKLEEIEREKQRMASGKDLIEAKRRLEEQEMKEMIAQKQREKREDKAARDRVKAQIEEDRLARKAKFGGGGSGTSITESPPVSVKPSPMEVDVVKKDYTHTKLQLRLPSGKTMTQTFGVSEPLAAVRVYIEMNRDDGVEGSFNLITNFPRKTFVEDDYDKPLLTLGRSRTSHFLTLIQNSDGLGIFHKRRIIGKECHCQNQFTDCAKVRGRTDKRCNDIVKRKHLCKAEFATVAGAVVEKITKKSSCPVS